MSNKQTTTVEVKEGQYVPIPETKKNVLAGPGTIIITRYGNGNVSGEVTAGSPITVERAVKLQLQRVSWDI